MDAFNSPDLQLSVFTLFLLYPCYQTISKQIGLPPISVLSRATLPILGGILLVFWVFYRLTRGVTSSTPGILDFTISVAESIASFFNVPPLLVNDIFGIVVLHALVRFYYTTFRRDIRELSSLLKDEVFDFAKSFIIPFRKKLEKEVENTRKNLEKELKDEGRKIIRKLPREGRDHTEILQEMKKRSDIENKKWIDGRVSGTVYCGETKHVSFLNSVFALNPVSNPLHADIWPSLSKYEGEICAITANMLQGDDSVVGFVSSGGSESIFLAVKAHLSYFSYRRYPEIIASTTAHAALNKACEILNIRLIQLEPDPITFRLRPRDVEKYISSQTILIYSSAPNYPQGTIDPIEELGAIAKRHHVGLHVDACLGGFVLPFARKLGYDIPKFDFEVDGVTSMSCDTHKFGYSCKGTSVVLYRNKDLRHAQYFCYPNWTGGLYATPAISGSRSGAMLACAWASLQAVGESGFLSQTKKIMETVNYIAQKIPEQLHLLGGTKPDAMVVCLASKTLNIYHVAEGMKKKGWSLNSLQNPASIHICVTVLTKKEEFILDLKLVVADLADKGSHNKGEEGGVAAIYGMAGSLPSGPVKEILNAYLDVTLAP